MENNIPGYMTVAELELLHALFAPYNQDSAIGVEIGSLHGRSSYTIANAIPLGTLYCIDNWNDFNSNHQFSTEECIVNNFPQPGTQCTLQLFKENVKVCKNILPIQGNSPEVVKDWDYPVDFVFLDALHANPSDWDNIEFWLPKIKPSGILSGHDFYSDNSQFPDVYDNVRRLEKQLGPVNNPVNSLWYFTIQ